MPIKYSIDESLKTSTLEIQVGGVTVTSYTYNDGQVTIGVLNPVDVHESELQTNLGYILKWIGIVKSELRPPSQKRAKFTEDIDKKNNNVKATFKNEGNTITDAQFDPDTRIFAFGARPQVIINFNCFESWYLFLNRFFRTGVEF